MCEACSGGSKDRDRGSTTSAQLAVSAAPEAGMAPTPVYPDFSYAVALAMQPWTQCTIYPEGNSGDAAHTNVLSAGASGEVRFYPPSADWGERLTLNCTLNGSTAGTYLVDLTDPSTFTRKSQADLVPHVTRTRPALTGDLSALSLDDLLQQGYPPRPDASKDVSGYKRWTQAVTGPVDVFNGMLVAVLGRGFSTYQGTINCNWTGFVQSANGFANLGCGIEAEYTGTLYDMYAMTMFAPTSGCTVPGSACLTALWGGVGGSLVNLTDFGLGVVGPTALIQSGFALVGNSASAPFVQFAPNGYSLPTPPSDRYTAGDTFLVWGWAASDVMCDPTTGGPQFGCFGFEDESASPPWVFAGPDLALNAPTSATFIPATAEFIAEVSSAPTNGNASYGYDYMYAAAWDETGTEHLDPGGGESNPDPYIYTQQNDSSNNPYSTAEWDNATLNSPVDPMFFLWSHSQ